jgi:hypothetical protein
MRPRLARRLAETLGSALCLAIVVGTLVAADDRVRDRLSLELSGNAMSGWAGRARSIAFIVLDTAREQTQDNAALVAFAVVALVLVFFMLRT